MNEENPVKYFEDIISNTHKSTSEYFSVILNVEYINSSSIKQLLDYFFLLKQLKNTGKFRQINITWDVKEDIELIELVEDLAKLCELDIEIIK